MEANVLNRLDPPVAGSMDNVVKLYGTVYSNKVVQTLSFSATLAQINAGTVLIPGVTGKTITVHSFKAKSTGAFITATAVVLEDTNGTPVVIASMAVAALTNGALLNDNTANVTMGAGYLAALTSGAGIQIAKTGSTAAGGTSIAFDLQVTIA